MTECSDAECSDAECSDADQVEQKEASLGRKKPSVVEIQAIKEKLIIAAIRHQELAEAAMYQSKRDHNTGLRSPALHRVGRGRADKD